jgi:hypothetical protein
MIRLLISIAILASSSAYAAKTKNLPANYPAQDRREFMDGCMSGNWAMRAFCSCVLVKFQETMTFAEFQAMNELTDEEIGKHKPYASAIIKCAKTPN